MDNTTATESVAEWNADLALGLIPNTVILSLYIILGITGNGFVILIYGFRMNNKSDDRYFIPILAASDLVASSVCGSFGIALNMMQAEFTNWRLCKAWWFFAAYSTFMSVFLLLVIATHRYLKLCRPFGKQMTLLHKRLAVGLSFTLAILMAAPTTALYGSVEFPKVDSTLVGRRCSKLKDVSKAGTLVYGVLVVIMVTVSMTIMIVFYSKIGNKIYKHFKYSTAVSNNIHLPNDVKSDVETSTTIISNEESTSAKDTRKDLDSKEKNNGKNVSKGMENKKTRTKEERNRQIMHKFTIMFMIITTVFLICYIPKVILLVIEGLNPKFWEHFSDSQRAGVLFVYRFYIVNNIVNPAIYAFMDIEFRHNTKAMIMCNKK